MITQHRHGGRSKRKHSLTPVSPSQAAKITALQAAYRRKEAETPRDDNAPTAGQLRTLGLLDRTDEEVNIFPAKFIPKVEHNNAPRKDERR